MNRQIISVLIISYNQEKVIRRSMESVLRQKDFVKSVIVFDDNSTDDTIEILKAYQKKHKDLIKIVKNSQNQGIFRNIENKWRYPVATGLVYDLAGDDEVPLGWFAKVFNYVRSNNLDIDNEEVAIYGDFECRYPSGDLVTYKNRDVLLSIDLVRLYERGRISNRSVCYSAKVKNYFVPVASGDSYAVENLQDLQQHYFVKDAHYIPCVGNIYYTRIGVGSQLNEKRLLEHEETMYLAYKWLMSMGYSISIFDRYLPHKNMAWKRFLRLKSIRYLFLFILYSGLTLDPRLGLNINLFRKWVFYFKTRAKIE